MLTVLMLTIILTVIGLAAITTTTMDMKMAGSEMMRERGESAAESCMSSGVQIIQQTLANSAIPPALTAAGANPAVTAAPLQSEIMGYPGFEALGWVGVLLPAGTPKPIVDKYSAEMVRLVKLPELRARLYEQTLMPVGDNAESFARTLKRDMALWQQNATAAGIKPQ